jgi:signal transduction histidine kinase
MSALAHELEVPESAPVEYTMAFDLVSASDLCSGLARALSTARRASGAARVEWWEGDDFVAADGLGGGPQRRVKVGAYGTFVFYGGRLDPHLAGGLAALLPLLRRLRADDLLARHAGELLRRNQALEEFAGLVAHELRTPLHDALAADDASKPVQEALDLVDALLDAAHDVRPFEADGATAEYLARELGPRVDGVEITSELSTPLPITVGAFRIILRNLVTNALAAGAKHIQVRAVDPFTLVVDDDGAGLDDPAGYESGSGLGLELSRRVAGTFGARIQLAPRQDGGTRATLAFEGLS